MDIAQTNLFHGGVASPENSWVVCDFAIPTARQSERGRPTGPKMDELLKKRLRARMKTLCHDDSVRARIGKDVKRNVYVYIHT